jgi:putative ABC transport system permease protein
MQIHPILSAIRRNKVGAALIALQIAVTLAILCNAISIVRQRLALTDRPSGVDVANIFTIANQWVGSPDDLAARIQEDVAALRALPGVVDAYESNSRPFNGGGMGLAITLHPDDASPGSYHLAPIYFGDQGTLDTLGVRLVAGHNFDAADVVDYNGMLDHPATSGMFVTRTLADKLAPGGQVLGRIATLFPLSIHAPIVGIIDELQGPFVGGAGAGPDDNYNSVVLPYRVVSSGAFYIVRARPGRLAEVMKTAPAALARLSRQRVITQVQSLAEARRTIYHSDRTVALMLTLVCVILVAITAFGIVGLTSYWVSQRWRQIGIRRALGATRPGIVRYFQIENFVISVAGVVVGVALGLLGNLWTVERFAMARLPLEYPLLGVIAMLLLGQLAVLWPALRAASIPPAIAARSA